MKWKQLFRFGAIVSLIGWAIIRALPVWLLFGQYGVNVWIFLFLDIATVFPYVLGIEALAAKREVLAQYSIRKLIALNVVVLVSFLLPYAYLFWAGGMAMPQAARLLLAAMIIVLAALSMRRFLHLKKR